MCHCVDKIFLCVKNFVLVTLFLRIHDFMQRIVISARHFRVTIFYSNIKVFFHNGEHLTPLCLRISKDCDNVVLVLNPPPPPPLPFQSFDSFPGRRGQGFKMLDQKLGTTRKITNTNWVETLWNFKLVIQNVRLFFSGNFMVFEQYFPSQYQLQPYSHKCQIR